MRITEYPEIKFAAENDVMKQIVHIRSELDEFIEAWVLACFYKYTQPNPEKYAYYVQQMAMEAQDAVQSTVTLVDIVDKQHPEVEAWGYREKMIEKNTERIYYAHQQAIPAAVGE